MAFILDDILFAPINAILFIGKKVHEMAVKETLDESGVRRDLRDLYSLFEKGGISENEFESREEELIEKLEKAQAVKNNMEP